MQYIVIFVQNTYMKYSYGIMYLYFKGPKFLILRASSQFIPRSKLTIDHRTKDGTTTKTFHCHELQ